MFKSHVSSTTNRSAFEWHSLLLVNPHSDPFQGTVQACKIPISGVSCSTCHLHQAPWKSGKTHTPGSSCTLKIGCEYPTPFSRQTPEASTDEETENANLSPQHKSPEYRENHVLKQMIFLHYIPSILHYRPANYR